MDIWRWDAGLSGRCISVFLWKGSKDGTHQDANLVLATIINQWNLVFSQGDAVEGDVLDAAIDTLQVFDLDKVDEFYKL